MSFTAKIDADIRGFEDGVDKASQAINKLQSTVESKLTSIGTAFQIIGAKASILSAGLVGIGAKAFTMAADFEDAMGATEQIFKGSSGIIKDWADNLSSSYGIAKKEAIEHANIMGSMLQNIGGLSEEMAGKTAGNLVELAGDLTAMFGGQTSDAVRALTGALKGNNTMLDNYGMAVNDALVKAKAFELGLTTGTGELSLQAKQAATLALIWEQTGAAQGQAARSADGASGSMRSLKTEVTNLSTELGEVLLPVITPIISRIRDMVASFRELSPETQKMMVVVAGVAAAFGPLMLIVGKVITLLPLLKSGIAVVTASLAGITAPVALAVAGIAALVGGIIYFSTRTKEATSAADAFARINKIANESIRGEIAQLNVLLKIAKDEKISKDKRIEAIKKINAISPEYLGALKLETIGTKQADVAVKNYTDSLRENARQRAVLSKVTELETKRVRLEEKLLKEQGRKLNPYLGGTEETRANAITLINRQISAIDKQIDVYSSFVSVTKSGGTEIKNILDDTNLTLTDTTKIAKSIGDTADTTTAKIERLAVNLKDLNTIALPTTPQLTVGQTDPLGGLSMQAYADKYRQTAEEIKEITIDLNQYITDAVVNMSSAVANALMNGDNVLQAIGSSLLGSLGAVMIDLGKMTILAGSAIEAIKKALTSLSGIGAIAVGAGLIAIGSLFAAGASKLGRSMGGGGSSYASAPTMSNTTSPVSPNYRGAYTDNEVVFKIGTNELVGVLGMAQNRNNRL